MDQQFDVRFVTLSSGARIRVVECGEGPTILLLHGIPTSSMLWRSVMPALAPHARAIAIDLLGYGGSDQPADFLPTLTHQVEVVTEICEQLQLTDVIVVGHDIGGGIAQLFCCDHPETVRGLVLIDTIAYDSFPEPGIDRLKDPEWDDRIQQIDLSAGLLKGLTKGSTKDSDALSEVAQMYAQPFEGRSGREAYLRAARAIRTQDLTDRIDDIEAITQPVLIVWGDEDVFQPKEYGERLAAALCHGRLHIVPGGRHFLPEDEGQLVAELILQL